jgi:hypothetical protein
MLKLTRLAASLALATGFINLLPATATAQKPALVRNVDEPGRSPYQHGVIFNQSPSDCSNYSCTVYFPAVPAGYRLVVTYASAFYKLGNGSAGGSFASVSLGADYDDNARLMLPRPLTIGDNTYIASGPITYYVEPGRSPILHLDGSPVATDGGFSAQVTVVGYLVAIP